MAYASWSVVFGEQPTAAKWNILGTNDASFNDGTGIANDAITSAHVSGIDKSNLTTDYNPYKFSAYRSANSASFGATAKIPFDAEAYDTNSNFDTTNNRYTAPVTGYYHFESIVRLDVNNTYIQTRWYKNGSAIKWGGFAFFNTSGIFGATSTLELALTAGDYIEVYNSSGATSTLQGGTDACVFAGHLLSRT